MNVSVSNTNGNSRQPSCIRAYADGKKVAELLVNKRNPLGYLRSVRASKWHVSLCEQLEAAMNAGSLTIEQANKIKSDIFPLIH